MDKRLINHYGTANQENVLIDIKYLNGKMIINPKKCCTNCAISKLKKLIKLSLQTDSANVFIWEFCVSQIKKEIPEQGKKLLADYEIETRKLEEKYDSQGVAFEQKQRSLAILEKKRQAEKRQLKASLKRLKSKLARMDKVMEILREEK